MSTLRQSAAFSKVIAERDLAQKQRDAARAEVAELQMKLVMQVKLELEAYCMALMAGAQARPEFLRRMPGVLAAAYAASGLPVNEDAVEQWRARATTDDTREERDEGPVQGVGSEELADLDAEVARYRRDGFELDNDADKSTAYALAEAVPSLVAEVRRLRAAFPACSRGPKACDTAPHGANEKSEIAEASQDLLRERAIATELRAFLRDTLDALIAQPSGNCYLCRCQKPGTPGAHYSWCIAPSLFARAAAVK
jgi:hypothetical protein